MKHAEQRLLKNIKMAGGLFDAEINNSIFTGAVMRKLMQRGVVIRNSLGMYVAAPDCVEWTNAGCEYDLTNKLMSEDL